MTPRSVLVVGAGLAGARCAETLRAEGYDGSLVVVGDELLAPYERPALSKAFLAGAKTEHELLLRAPTYWAEQHIDLRLGRRVLAVDPASGTATTAAGEELHWDALRAVNRRAASTAPVPGAARRAHPAHRHRCDSPPRRPDPGRAPRRDRRRLRRRRGRLDRPRPRRPGDDAGGARDPVRAHARPDRRPPPRRPLPLPRRPPARANGRSRIPHRPGRRPSLGAAHRRHRASLRRGARRHRRPARLRAGAASGRGSAGVRLRRRHGRAGPLDDGGRRSRRCRTPDPCPAAATRPNRTSSGPISSDCSSSSSAARTRTRRSTSREPRKPSSPATATPAARWSRRSARTDPPRSPRYGAS